MRRRLAAVLSVGSGVLVVVIALAFAWQQAG